LARKLSFPVSQQSVLTRQQAQSIVQGLAKADPATTDLGPQISRFFQVHGQYAQQAWGDLVKAGLPQQYQLLRAIDNPVARSEYQRALQGINKKGQANFEADIPAQASSDIKARLDEALDDFRRSAAFSRGPE
jgi:hypothetical protein